MNVVVTIALIWLMLVALALAFALAAQGAGRKLARRRGESAALAVLAIAATLCAQKAVTTRWTFDSYVQDAGCWASNSTVHVELAQREPGIDLTGSPVLLYAREIGVDDPEAWTELLPRRTFAELPADYALANATNHDFIVFVDYVPPPTVRTNGVWQMRGIELGRAAAAARYAFPNTTAKAAPPTTSDYVQGGLVAMWDGIERGDNPRVWRDVSGNGWDLTVTAGSEWLVNALSCSSYQEFGIASMPNRLIPAASVEHVEVTCFATAKADNPLIFYNGASALKNSRNIVITAARLGVETSQERRHSACVLGTGLIRISATWEKLYIDGERVTDTTFTRDTWSGGSESFALFGRSSDTKYAVAGRVYCVRVYNRELTPDEIRHNCKIDRERFNLP